MTLSQLDGCRIAVVLEGHGEGRVVCGVACYEIDEHLGNCLRVRLEETPGNAHFLFPEAAYEFEFEPDSQFGCDYTVTV